MNVELDGIVKRFGPTVACDGVRLALRAGEVTALLGENGAGKSTLMKILFGVLAPDQGQIRVEGRPVRIESPRAARALGIGMLFQQLSLIDALSVSENLACGAADTPFWLPRRANARQRAAAQLAELAPDIDPSRRASDLSPGEKQLVELSKLLAGGARLVILDEPTSLLARPEAERLWQRLRELARRGCSVVLITHKLEDVAACADRVLVLRAGRVVLETHEVAEPARLLEAMLGSAPPAALRRQPPASAAPRLVVEGLSASLGDQQLEGVSFELRPGAILGVAGVTGNGQELLGRVLAGVRRPEQGRLALDALPLAAADARVAYVPEQPLLNAVAASQSLLLNLGALQLRQRGWRSLSATRPAARALLSRFDVRPPELERAAGTLSGGNLQKLVLARELSGEPALIVACFPTMGLDAVASQRLCGELLAHAERGACVVWIGEDLDALLAHADEVAVLYRGRLHGPVPVARADRRTLGAWMTGAAA